MISQTYNSAFLLIYLISVVKKNYHCGACDIEILHKQSVEFNLIQMWIWLEYNTQLKFAFSDIIQPV